MADDPGEVAIYEFGTHALWAYQSNGLGSRIFGTAYLPRAPIPLIVPEQFQVPPQADPTQIQAVVFHQQPKPQPIPAVHQIFASPQTDPTQVQPQLVKKQPANLPSGVFILGDSMWAAPQDNTTQIQPQLFRAPPSSMVIPAVDSSDWYEWGTHALYNYQSNGLGSKIFGSIIQNITATPPPNRPIVQALPQADLTPITAQIFHQSPITTNVFLTMHPWGARDEYQDIQPQLYSAPPGTVSIQSPVIGPVLFMPEQINPRMIMGQIFHPAPQAALTSPTLYATKQEWGTHEKYIQQSQNRSWVQGGPMPPPLPKPLPFRTARYEWGTHEKAVMQAQNRSFIMQPQPAPAPIPTGNFLNFQVWGEREEYQHLQGQISHFPPGSRLLQTPVNRMIPQAFQVDNTQIQGRIFGAQPPSAIGGATPPTLLMLGVGN